MNSKILTSWFYSTSNRTLVNEHIGTSAGLKVVIIGEAERRLW